MADTAPGDGHARGYIWRQTAMAHYGIADAKNRLPALVSASERVTITRHGKPVAELRPLAKRRKRVSPASLDRLEQQLADLPASEEDSVEQLDALRGERDSG